MPRGLLLILLSLTGLMLPVRPPAPAFAAPSADRCRGTAITSPHPGQSQRGIVSILGRAGLPDSFLRYQVDFSATGLGLWVLVADVKTQVDDGLLARWDTTGLPDGAYDLRLRAVDSSGNYCEMAVGPFYVAQKGAIAVTGLPAEFIRIPTLSGNVFVPVDRVPELGACTHSWDLGPYVTWSVRLCPGETYAPFAVTGDGVAVIGDPTAVVAGYGRGFGVRVTGSGVLLAGVNVAGTTDPADVGRWLCLYPTCDQLWQRVNGGTFYGGGILLDGGSNSTVLNAAVTGGVAGVAVVNGHGHKVLNSRMTNLTGWGIYIAGSANSFFVGNTLSDINRACIAPDGQPYGTGCESAGLVCIGCEANLIADNNCTRSGNCFYLNGDGQRPDNFNKLYRNRCTAPSHNCFEITYSQGVEMDGNFAAIEPGYSQGCALWLAEAQVLAGASNAFEPCNHKSSRTGSTLNYAQPSSDK